MTDGVRNVMEWTIIPGASIFAVALAVAIGLLIRRPSGPTADHRRYPYRLQPSVLSAAERTFFGVLAKAVGDTYEVLGKVRVADVLAPHNELTKGSWKDAFERIAGAHFDFVLCDQDMHPAAVVELDNRADPDYGWGENLLIDRVAHAARLRVIRFEEQGSYSVNAVRGKVLRGLDAPVAPNTQRMESA